jgi:uncharacterized protein
LTASAVYEGWVRHRRFEPIEHEFRYRLFLMYLDLGELPEVLDPYPLFSARRPAPARFRREDFMGDPARPLDECARDAVEAETGSRPAGPVRLLAGLRCLGHSFNPVSFYYCFDGGASNDASASGVSGAAGGSSSTGGGGGEKVAAVVADVNSIPWGERHAYVLARGGDEGPVLRDELDKRLHVSPLMGMDQTYAFRAGEPGARLAVHIESRPRSEDGKSFDATLVLRRRELSRPLLGRMLARYPAMSLQVVAKIYAQSLRLKLKGARSFPHPEGRRPKGFISP